MPCLDSSDISDDDGSEENQHLEALTTGQALVSVSSAYIVFTIEPTWYFCKMGFFLSSLSRQGE